MKKTGTEVRHEVDRFQGALYVSGKALATDSIDLPAAHTSLLVQLSRKALRKLKKESRDLDSEDVEELAKQTLLSTKDVKMWVTQLDSVKKRRQAGTRKAAATRKQKSARQKSSDKVTAAGNEFWRLCGGPESRNMIACDNPGCSPIREWFHFEYVGLVDAPVESGFTLNVLFNIFKAISLQKCFVAT